MLLARREDFEPLTATERANAMYYNPEDNSGYIRYPFFTNRIDKLRGRFAPNNQKLAVWGCGFGYLVDMAQTAGYSAYGFDAAQYAIDKGKALLPAISARLFVRNALLATDMTPARRDAGLPGGQRFPILVTEDLLTSLTDAEVTIALTNLRSICSSNLLHVVWPLDPTTTQDPRLNWKTIDQWRAICCPPDLVYDAVENRIWDAAGEVL